MISTCREADGTIRVGAVCVVKDEMARTTATGPAAATRTNPDFNARTLNLNLDVVKQASRVTLAIVLAMAPVRDAGPVAPVATRARVVATTWMHLSNGGCSPWDWRFGFPRMEPKLVGRMRMVQ